MSYIVKTRAEINTRDIFTALETAMELQPRQFCIHGHFYQPPREDPWMGRILVEPSAAPSRHWNERIVDESYGPVGWAHRIGRDGRIIEICNCYEWMSFNVGPTLLAWLERRRPGVYARILEADAASLKRWGHGNAMAQAYHHMILPLASRLDKELETQWAVADFEARFHRKPEGMWLAESAVDGETLDVLAAAGIRFVILSPHQAKAVAGENGEFSPVNGSNFDVARPYNVILPAGGTMAVFFYHGALSQAVAFERLLENGENFWNRINRNASGGLLTLATDGETYGHHFRFGEMALAYVLAQGREGRDGLGLTNPAAYLAANPPRDRALLHEPSSWSCAHGVERWRSDCGCKDGGHPDWNQKWRAPLREALAEARSALDEHFFRAGAACFRDAGKALRAFGRVLADNKAGKQFAAEHIVETREHANLAWKLLTMQEQALAAFASCAWFFDDISRIEPVNGMTFMWRAMELALETGGPDLRERFSSTLSRAVSNKAEEGTGADILRRRVMPRQLEKTSLCLLALLLMDLEDSLPEPGEEKIFTWPAFSVAVTVDKKQPGDARVLSGSAVVGTPLEKGGEAFAWTWHAPCRERLAEDCAALGASSLTVAYPDGRSASRSVAEMARHTRDYLALRYVEALKKYHAPRAEATARHVLSLAAPWEEAQTSLPYAWDWTALAPYLLLACVLDASASHEKRARVVAFCNSMGLPPLVRENAAKMAEKAMLRDIADETPDWRRLAGRVERSREFLPETNLWAVRNAFWQRNPAGPEAEALRRALGFA